MYILVLLRNGTGSRTDAQTSVGYNRLRSMKKRDEQKEDRDIARSLLPLTFNHCHIEQSHIAVAQLRGPRYRMRGGWVGGETLLSSTGKRGDIAQRLLSTNKGTEDGRFCRNGVSKSKHWTSRPVTIGADAPIVQRPILI